MKKTIEQKILIQIRSFVSLVEYHQNEIFSPKQDKALEEFKAKIKDANVRLDYFLWSWWESLTAHFPQDKYLKQIASIRDLKSQWDSQKINQRTRKSQVQKERSLEDLHTKELLKKLDHGTGTSNEEQDKIKAILKTREHVPNKSQAKLIRKMSVRAGKKLTLREAQILKKKV